MWEYIEYHTDCPPEPYIRELRWNDAFPFYRLPEEYDGASTAKLSCTQHAGTSYQQKKITDRWVDFLTSEQLPLEEVQFCTSTPQKILDAISTQQSVRSLRFKWFTAKDLLPLANMKNLERLYLGNLENWQDLSAVGSICSLRYLGLENPLKIRDYSFLKQLENLETLHFSPSIWRGNTCNMDNLEFVNHMPKLRSMLMSMVRVQDPSALSPARIETMGYICFQQRKK